jgi:hypothetical protein
LSNISKIRNCLKKMLKVVWTAMIPTHPYRGVL